jgi:hypothetical protein
LSEIEPCDQTRCGWDLVSDEGQKIGKVRDLIDIVSIVDKPNNERVSRFTTRANPNTEFSFYDEKGNFCEIFAKLCTHIIRSEPAGAHAAGG